MAATANGSEQQSNGMGTMRCAFTSSRMCGGIVTVRCSPFFVVSIRQRSAPGVFGSARCVTPREMVTTVQSAVEVLPPQFCHFTESHSAPTSK